MASQMRSQLSVFCNSQNNPSIVFDGLLLLPGANDSLLPRGKQDENIRARKADVGSSQIPVPWNLVVMLLAFVLRDL